MEARGLRFSSLSLLILISWLAFACATGTIADKEKKPKGEMTAEERSRQEWEARVLENTWYEGAGYYRGRDDKGAIDVGEWLRTRKELKAKQEETNQRLAKLEREASRQQMKGQTVAAQTGAAVSAVIVQGNRLIESALKFKVALIVYPHVYRSGPDIMGIILKTAAAEFAQNPLFILVKPEEAEEILEQQGLSINKGNERKIAEALGVYPAARLVLFVDELILGRSGKSVEGKLSYSVVDGFSGRTVDRKEEIVSSGQDVSDQVKVLRGLFTKMIDYLQKKAAKYRWSSRVAMVKGKKVYLSAGRASGLKKGDIFMVYGPGEEIIHPVAQVSMGFQQGPYKGRVEVVSLFGRDAAEATVLEGSGKIEPNDLITLPGEQH